MAATTKAPVCAVCRKAKAIYRIRLTPTGPLTQTCDKCSRPKKAKR